ncbi:MAG: SRPBCC family protein [Bacteroidetes bacterium]|nr:SRPBCC family protein [Bacteroidota bacterium]
MKVYSYQTQQLIYTSLETCWEFFSSPLNLEKITPHKLGFKIIGKRPDKMFPGQLIQYTVSPILGLKLNWLTEITQVKEHQYFIDEQRFGPYKLWHHQHRFKETEQGIEMIDIVEYALPFGFLGRILHKIFIRKQIEEIFIYRKKVIEELFPKKT